MDEIVDVDIMLKLSAYGLLSGFQDQRKLGLLAVSRYVVVKRLSRTSSLRNKQQALEEFQRFLERALAFEPAANEIGFAAMLETKAQELGLSLDVGESQLLAVLVHRHLERCWTGDKRAIASTETLIDHVVELRAVVGRVSCLEQAAVSLIGQLGIDGVRSSICAEPSMDIALSSSLSCYSPGFVPESIMAGLNSYIEALRRQAPRTLSN